MKKSEIIAKVAESTGQTEKVVGEVVNSLLDNIQAELANGGTVEFIGFGGFKVVDKDERIGVNPQTGEKIIVPAHKSPKFSAGKNFKAALNPLQ